MPDWSPRSWNAHSKQYGPRRSPGSSNAWPPSTPDTLATSTPPNSPAHNAKKSARYLSQPPSAQGLPIEFWDVPHLAEWIHDHFEVVYTCPTSYHFLLHMADLSSHHPGPSINAAPPRPGLRPA